MARAMFRYVVPIGGEHTILLSGDPVMVANSDEGSLEFWAEYTDTVTRSARVFRVFGTGHPIPDGAVYIGTAPRIHGFVWHLYELKGA